MEYEFTNGTAEQKALWEEALGHLLSLPSVAINAKVVVTFQDTIAPGHTDLAFTTWNYGSNESSTAVRSDAISFGSSQAVMEALAASLGLPYSVPKFYMESAIHELGHSLFAALPEEKRIAIAQMFGAKSDSIEELQPAGTAWQDRIMEGIAETFKEAFLPRAYRVFPNRTNRKIPYSEFPKFRALFREAMPEIVSGELGPEETAVPSISLDVFKQGGFKVGEGENVLAGVGGLWTTDMTHEAGKVSNLSSWALFEGWVKEGTALSYQFIVPTSIFELFPPFFDEHSLENYNSSLIWEVYRDPLFEGPVWFHDAIWEKSVEGYSLRGEAEGLPPGSLYVPPPIIVTRESFPGPSFRFCRGSVYVFVRLKAVQRLTVTGLVEFTEHEKLRDAVLYPWLPNLIINQPACLGGVVSGELVQLPSGLIAPGGAAGASHPHGRPIVGNIH